MTRTASRDDVLTALLSPKSGERRPAMKLGEATWSYGDLSAEVATTAERLRAMGVAKGDRVALLLGNSPEYVTAFLAVASLGALVVAIERDASAERLRFVLDDTAPRVCLHEPDSVPAMSGDVRAAPMAMACGGASRAPTFADAASPGVTADDPALILFSSGSTGRPKGVVLRHGQLLAIARTLVTIVDIGPDHRELILNPLTHSGAWQRVSATLLGGGCVVFPNRPLSIPGLLEDIELHRITGFFTTPPLVRMILATPPRRFAGRASTLRSIEIASAPLLPDELARLIELLPWVRVLFQYGSTECSRAVILDAGAHPDRLDTVGRPTAGVDVRIAGADDAGQEGEILLRAPQLTKGYWRRPELDRERLREGWLRTGDIGSVDQAGFVRVVGRTDDMINCGGLSYAPAEVETELGRIEGVEDYLIAGVEDPQGILTQVPWIFVVPADPASWSVAEFLAVARRTLPSHMVPRGVEVVPSIPLTSTGKPCRKRTVLAYGPDGERHGAG